MSNSTLFIKKSSNSSGKDAANVKINERQTNDDDGLPQDERPPFANTFKPHLSLA